MSYEGYLEYLCGSGHYMRRDCNADAPEKCRVCDAPITRWHSVDQTNGMIKGLSDTMPAPKQQIGSTDVWNVDHYGNRYAVSVPQYQPLEEWRRQSEGEG